MTTEEKAKAYDEAIKKAKFKLDCCDSDLVATKNTIYYIFSELEKSEDERIRKQILDCFKTMKQQGCFPSKHKEQYNSWIAWLEKQGEQKQQDKEYTFKSIPRLLDMIEPSKKAKFYCQKLIDTLTKEGYNTDANIVGYCLKMMNGEKVAMATMDEEKQSPKFKVGDWITNSIETVQITGYDIDYGYQVDCKDNLQHRDTDIIEKEYHLWSIADAKPGDVLATNSWLYVFKYTNNKNLIQFYYTCPINGETFKWCFLPNDSYLDIYIDANIHPATKEQQKLLFEKIAEAGYEWDAEKKELKKIEQISTDKVGIKFKVGDWIVNDYCMGRVVEITNDAYLLDTGQGIPVSCEHNAHLWSISDAKDGDVLVCCDNKPFIFKGFFDLNFPNCLAAYCGITLENQFRHCNGKTFWTNQDVKPATKEQQKLLFEKMTDAGYEWNAEKKELKKIELKPDDLIEEGYQQQADDLIDMVTETTWSEEDERIFKATINTVSIARNCCEEDDEIKDRLDDELRWLKSIKNRVQPQPKQDGKWKWEEDDEKFFKENILIGLGNADDVSEELYNKVIDWINLIKKRLS